MTRRNGGSVERAANVRGMGRIIGLCAAALALAVGLYARDILKIDASGDLEALVPDKPNGLRFIVVSDTQDPIPSRLLRKYFPDKQKPSDYIFSAILAEPEIDALLHLGDITAFGFWNAGWKRADAFFQTLNERSVAVFPLLGNHEYLVMQTAGKRNFLRRFPMFQRSWYLVRMGVTAFVMLNSNFAYMARQESEAQLRWYERTMAALEADARVQAVVVCSHCPPYTESQASRSSKRLRREYIPIFTQARKTRLFLSGHFHSYEHFRRDGKEYIISGGGGGLIHQPMLVHDRPAGETPGKIFYHYLRGLLHQGRLELTVRMLSEDFSTVRDFAVITIPLLTP